MTKLEELLARVEACGERGNFQLECDLGAALGTHPNEKRGSLTLQATPPPFTRSLDAALSLAEAKLPGSHWRVEKTCERPALAFRTHQFTGYCGNWGTPSRAEGPTPALALLAAMLKALIAQDAQKVGGAE